MEKTTVNLIRQGDITLRRVETRPQPAGAGEEVVLAFGEESGHFHAIRSTVDEMVDGKRFITVLETVPMMVGPETHGWRHEPITLEPGTYEVLGQPDPVAKWAGQREYVRGEIVRSGD